MNKLLYTSLRNKNKLVGQKVRYKGYSDDRIKNGQTYTIKDVLLGNHCCLLKLKELPDRLCYPFTSRKEGSGNIFNAKLFELESEVTE